MSVPDAADEPTQGNDMTPPEGVPVIVASDIKTLVTIEINRQVKAQVSEAISGGGPPGGGSPPSKTFLAKWWGASIFKAALGLCALAFAWYMSVNTGLAARPTEEEARVIARDEAARATRTTHPDTKLILKAHSNQLRQLSDTAIRQTIILEGQARSIEKIEEKIEHRGR